MRSLMITAIAWLVFLSAVISILRLAFTATAVPLPEQIIAPVAILLLAVTLLVRAAAPAVVVPLALCACGLSLVVLALVIRRRSP